VAQERLERLQGLQRTLTIGYHRSRVGSETEILVEGPSRKGGGLQGRDPQHRIVHLAAGAAPDARPGSLVRVRISEATPHSLLGETCASGEDPRPARAFLSGAAASGR
jgi:tRNA-2-methylthio-N6-dimethylallyladenosine synthase